MFESGLNDVVDYVLAVVAEEGVRIARSQNRDHLTEEQIRLRMARQLPLQETIERSDFILHNNGSLDSLQQKVRFFHSIFIALKPRPVRNHDHH